MYVPQSAIKFATPSGFLETSGQKYKNTKSKRLTFNCHFFFFKRNTNSNQNLNPKLNPFKAWRDLKKKKIELNQFLF